MPDLFSAPIPGQSLTRQPKNAPWENPPKHVKPEEALQAYMKKYSDPDVLDDMLELIEAGFPITAIVETATTTAVMSGIHTVEISIILKPVLHEFFKGLAEAAGIKYNEGFKGDKARKEREKERIKAKFERYLKTATKDAGTVATQELLAAPDEAPVEAPMEADVMPMEEPMMEEAPAKRGLMAKKGI